MLATSRLGGARLPIRLVQHALQFYVLGTSRARVCHGPEIGSVVSSVARIHGEAVSKFRTKARAEGQECWYERQTPAGDGKGLSHL